MNIDTSYTNIQPTAQSSSLERIASSLAINKASDNASGLSIADKLGMQKNSISQVVENMNSGIAMSNIAQSGIASQKDILSNMKTEILKAMNGTTNQDGRETIKDQLSKYIEQYDQITQSTTYNGEKLLETTGDSTDDLSIVDMDSFIGMEKVDTADISNQLKTFLADFSTNSNSMDDMLKAVDSGIDQLASYASEFGSAANAMESNARNAISTEVNIASAKSTILDINYNKEVSDFSKSNLLNQIGLLAQSQSNAIQSRNISLLT